jgi:hypothetical protein
VPVTAGLLFTLRMVWAKVAALSSISKRVIFVFMGFVCFILSVIHLME